VLGLWGNARASNDPRSHDFGAARVVTSLAEAQEQLDQLAHRRTVVGVPHAAL
jgi:hypothetical protein